jgi:3-deoxy-7-phosphoheptulonate synthase
MIVVMRADATAKQVSNVIGRIKDDGYQAHLSEGEERTIIGVVGHSPTPLKQENYDTMDGVDKVLRVSAPYKLASREFHPNDTHVPLNGSQMGGKQVLVIAGPCSVESREQIIETACAVKEAGATALRGGPSSRERRHIASRGTARKGCNGWRKHANALVFLSLQR